MYVALRAGGVAQVIEPLPSKCEALSSNSSTAKKNATPLYEHLPSECGSFVVTDEPTATLLSLKVHGLH
jgi:hypothetical protein